MQSETGRGFNHLFPGRPASSVLNMSKAMQKKSHWSARVSECAVRRDARGDVNVPLQGGAENGEFVYVGRVDPGSISYEHGTLTEGELVLEVETLPLSGLPLYDVLNAIKNSRGPVRLRTVRQGKEAGSARAERTLLVYVYIYRSGSEE